MKTDVSPEEQLQEAFVNWVLSGGSLMGFFTQVDMFIDGLVDISEGGPQMVALERLSESIDRVLWLAGKADRAGLPKYPPADRPQPKPAEPVTVLVETFEGLVSQVRASAPVEVTVWEHGEVREGLVPTRLLAQTLYPVRFLSEDEADQASFPETKQAGGITLYLFRRDGKVQFDRKGRPVYVTIPGSEVES